MLFFNHRHIWRIYYDITDVEFELIASFWPTLPTDLQAAYENPKDRILVFKGKLSHYDFSLFFWMSELDSGYFVVKSIIFMHEPND